MSAKEEAAIDVVLVPESDPVRNGVLSGMVRREDMDMALKSAY